MVLRIEFANLKKVPESWVRSSGIWHFFGFANSNFKCSKRASKISWLFSSRRSHAGPYRRKVQKLVHVLWELLRSGISRIWKSSKIRRYSGIWHSFSDFRNITSKFSKRACNESQHFSSWHSQTNPSNVRPPKVETLFIPLDTKRNLANLKSSVLRTSRILNAENFKNLELFYIFEFPLFTLTLIMPVFLYSMIFAELQDLQKSHNLLTAAGFLWRKL